ncbi:hypothetical protein TNIN_351921 [Trichonephila inaurata madagascariensis]|uniref:Uncharacterized protein n=1 Tax=Trichonephila inaurata madagascariensis TaxID=2747483 RepID=A0A8X6WZX4_9ARAC|nr:hypothetical protein TNIN_351921 [Trichonephila inaurata madagascariensis]
MLDLKLDVNGTFWEIFRQVGEGVYWVPQLPPTKETAYGRRTGVSESPVFPKADVQGVKPGPSLRPKQRGQSGEARRLPPQRFDRGQRKGVFVFFARTT